jgi:hypothetical protein
MNLTPQAIVQTLSTIGKEIDELTVRLVEAEQHHMEARREHRRAYAVAFLANKTNGEGKPYTVNEREHMAFLATEDTGGEADRAEYAVTALKDELRAKRDRMEIGRSLSAVMRLEWAGS